MKSTNIRLFKADFEESITPSELPMFRGVMIALSENHPLFHNHASQGFRYAYPKIQYKLTGSHPGILGIDEGAEILSRLLHDRNEIPCRLGKRNLTLHISSIAGWEEEIGFTAPPATYLIQDWLPLNAENFRDYRKTQGMIERLSMLQRILLGNILSFSKGMDIFFDDIVSCTIEDMESAGSSIFKGVELMNFSGRFTSNVRLPQWIGLGKSASLNHGTIIRL